jgi:DNA-binding HxlR family transcriptional regulator
MFHDCGNLAPPVRVGDKWTRKIMACLKTGPRRFSELQVPLQAITPKVLTESLRAMERDGIITRTAYHEVPPRVEYELTQLGWKLLDLVDVVCDWSSAYLPEMLDARKAYEERSA